MTGGLSAVTRIVKVTGFVASAPDFTGQPQVVNGASELLLEVFGDAGRHARSAVGMAVLPLDAPVEIELIAEVRRLTGRHAMSPAARAPRPAAQPAGPACPRRPGGQAAAGANRATPPR